jgi:hypothetical protein
MDGTQKAVLLLGLICVAGIVIITVAGIAFTAGC